MKFGFSQFYSIVLRSTILLSEFTLFHQNNGLFLLQIQHGCKPRTNSQIFFAKKGGSIIYLAELKLGHSGRTSELYNIKDATRPFKNFVLHMFDMESFS